MRFLDGQPPDHDLTYADVFLVPDRSDGRLPARRRPDHAGRHGHDDPDRRGQHDRGRRTADGRDGGPPRRPRRPPAGRPAGRASAEVVAWVKARHPVFETPITLAPARHRARRAAPAAQARARRRRRGRGRRRPVGVVTDGDCSRRRPVHPASSEVMTADLLTARRPTTDRPKVCARSTRCTTRAAGSPRSSTGRPAGRRPHPHGRAALDASTARRSTPPGGCGSPPPSASTATSRAKAEALLAAGVDVLVVDTAHGHQEKMLERAAAAVRSLRPAGAGGRRQRRHRRRRARPGRRRRRHRQGRRRARRHVHHADDDRRRPAAVLRRPGVRRGGARSSASTCGPTAGCATRATSPWRSPPVRPA